MTLRILTFYLPALTLWLTGCGTYAYHTGALRRNLANEEYEQAIQNLSMSGPDRLLYLLDRGIIAHYQGRYPQSNTFFEEAERLTDQLFTRSVSREIAALVTNDAVKHYRGEEFELVFIHYYRALNYWFLGLPEDALVESRKANLKLAYLAASSDFEANYRNDAFIHYMTGLFYEATGELNDAYVSYVNAEKAYQIYERTFELPPPGHLQKDIIRVDRALHQSVTPYVRLASATAGDIDRRSQNGELVLFSEIGFVPRKVEEEVNLPIFSDEIGWKDTHQIKKLSKKVARRYRATYPNHRDVEYWLRIAIPTYRESQPKTSFVRISAAGRTARSVPAEDLAAIAYLTFKDKEPAILAKTVARGLTKYFVTRGAKKKNKLFGFFANLFTAGTEAADTRSWVSLPNNIQISRLTIPAGAHDVKVEALDNNGRVITEKMFSGIEIQPGSRTFLNFRTFH